LAVPGSPGRSTHSGEEQPACAHHDEIRARFTRGGNDRLPRVVLDNDLTGRHVAAEAQLRRGVVDEALRLRDERVPGFVGAVDVDERDRRQDRGEEPDATVRRERQTPHPGHRRRGIIRTIDRDEDAHCWSSRPGRVAGETYIYKDAGRAGQKLATM